MIRAFFFLLLWGILFLYNLPVSAFEKTNFKKLTMQDGLADNSVYAIYKDKDGFIWFGTGDGLSRYDGRSIRSFTSARRNMQVRDFHDTSDGLLFFVANSDLHCFDRIRECFVPLDKGKINEEDKLPNITGLAAQNDSLYWTVSQNKLYLLKRELQRNAKNDTPLLSVKILEEHVLVTTNGMLDAVCLSGDGEKIFTTTRNNRKLIVFNIKERKIDRKIPLGRAKNTSSLLCDGDYVWIPTVGEGILRYHIPTHRVESFANHPGSKKILSHNDVYGMVGISHTDYFAVTWNGYTFLHMNDEGGLSTEINNQLAHSPQNLEIRMISAFYDPQGRLYIGTHGGGVIILDKREQFYGKYFQKSPNGICDVIADNGKHIWLSTFHGGIARSDEPFDAAKPLTFSFIKHPVIDKNKTVHCSLKDKEGNLWFGNSDASITFHNPSSGEYTVYQLNHENRADNNFVWKLFIDSHDRFWIGTRQGLFLFDRKEKTFSPVSADSSPVKYSVRAIAEGKNGDIFIGTFTGLYKLTQADDGTFGLKKNYEERAGIAARQVRALLASSDGHLYIGYTEGLGILSLKEDTIQRFYTTRDGLCSNFITCITEDAGKRIWLGTNSGISRYSRHQSLFYNYYISGSNRSCTGMDNMLFFGNNYALTYFDSDTVTAKSEITRNVLLDLEINNRRVTVGEAINKQLVLRKALPYTERIELIYENRNFALSFTNLLYSEELQKYNYRLLPYQREWIVSGGGEKASYMNLPAGNYIFEVKSIYPDGSTSAISTLPIRILPHWSRTWGFRICILALLSLTVWYIMHRIRHEQRFAKRVLKMKHELLVSNMERTKEKQVREERERFFTGVAHELRTPLTLVLSPLQELLQRKKNTDADYSVLSLIYKNGASLHRLVDDLLSVQKIEAGLMKLNLKEVNVALIVRETADSFRQLAAPGRINYLIDIPDAPVTLWADAEKLVSAVRNLLSNAFKYTPPGGEIRCTVSDVRIDEKDFCRVEVADTGVGVPADLQDRIFESFVTGNATPSISTKIGIGLRIVKNTMDMHHGTVTLKSEINNGSIFTLDFPKGKEQFAEDGYELTGSSETTASVAGETSNKETPEERNTQEPDSPAKKKHTLLIIEDNQDIRTYITSLFAARYHIVEAINGEEGMEKAKAHLPSLILSDVMMPVKDGITCCQEIRECQETSHIPILMLTAKGKDADMMKGLQIGADDYLMKPFNPEVLKAKVRNLIAGRERLKRIYTKALMLKQKEEDSAEDEFMRKVINIIETNLTNESFGVKSLAERLYVSQPTLYRKIKQRSELSIIELIRSVRMSKAASLIMEQRYSILEISEMVGFNDLNTFRKHFTEQFGVSPSKYSR